MGNVKDRDQGRVGFRVRVQPSAPGSRLLGWNAAGELRIKIAAPPKKGAANKELVSFLADYFSLDRGDIRIESGEKSRVKTVSAPASIRDSLLEIPEA